MSTLVHLTREQLEAGMQLNVMNARAVALIAREEI